MNKTNSIFNNWRATGVYIETTMTLTAQIFGLSTMVASFQIYNVQNRIQEDNLQHLALFSEYGRLAHSTSTSAKAKSEPRPTADRDSAEDSGSQDTPQQLDDEVLGGVGKPFQMLQFLVRDSSLIDDFDVNSSAEAQEAQYQALRAEMASEFKVRLAC
jgi:atlastin